MFNIEQELELTTAETFDSLRVDGERIYVSDNKIGFTYAFNRQTGVMAGYEEDCNPHRLRRKCGTKPVDVFRVYTGRQDWPKEHWAGLPSTEFETGTDAAAHAKFLNRTAAESESPYRFRVQKDVVAAPDQPWRDWMAQRFETGEYVKLPWADEPWADKYPDHFAHAFDIHVRYVIDGPRDRCERVTPGRYLTQFYSDVLTPTEIQKWATKVDVECELHFADTADEIERVYLAGPNSCMSHRLSDYHCDLPHHPVRVYAGGDLQLAYLTRRSKIVARALVWPEKMVHSRIYGDIERMRDRLCAEGYNENWNLSGARLVLTQSNGRIVLPYLDDCNASLRNGVLTIEEDGHITANRTDGWAGDGDEGIYGEDYDVYCCCDRCDCDIHDEDDAYSVDGETWCESCCTDYAGYCGSCTETFHIDNMTIVVMSPTDNTFAAQVCRSCASEYHEHNGHLYVELTPEEEPVS